MINCFKRRPDAVTRLICFPWAGGGSIHYARWGNVLSSSIEGNLEDVKFFASHVCCLLRFYVHNFSMNYKMMCFYCEIRIQKCYCTLKCMSHFLSLTVFAVKLPGRETRAKEPFFQNMQQIVDEVVGVLLPVLKDKPFALFGHRYDNNRGFISNI